MPNLNGLDAARQIVDISPQTRVLILTMHESEQIVREVLEVGARGFLLKPDAARDLASAIQALHRRTTLFPSSVPEMALIGSLDGRADTRNISKHGLAPRDRELV